MAKKVLLATEKAFSAGAVAQAQSIIESAGFTFAKLENYKQRAEFLAAVADCDAVIIRSDKANREMFDAATKLQLIVRAGAGVDNIDLAAATEKSVVAMNTPGMNSNAVAELAFGMMVKHYRNSYDGTSGRELRGRKLGLIGCGLVGVQMIKIAKGFGVDVMACDPYLSPDAIRSRGAEPCASREDIFSKCDFVSLHIPATPETTGCINKGLIMRLPKDGLLINTARLEVVDEAGLTAALLERKDLGYISDVQLVDATAVKTSLGERFAKQVHCTPKKMGAQTAEANNNCAGAAARQTVDFFVKGDVACQVNKSLKRASAAAPGGPSAKKARTVRKFLFSSESVNEGHPDKLCDQVSDAVLDTCLRTDPKSKVACETATKDNMVMVAGEITTQAKIDYDRVVRTVVAGIGFDSYVDDLASVDSKGLCDKSCEVLVRINKQSPDIAGGVHVGKEDLDVGAGDQGIMFGYASDETADCMPLTHSLATRLGKKLTDVRKSGQLWWLRPDGKTQVTIEYKQNLDGSVEPLKIHTVVISTQHAEPLKATRKKECVGYAGPDMTAPSMDQMNTLIVEEVVKRTLQEIMLKSGQAAITLFGDHTHLYINPSGKFIIGGPQGDAGLTGRKIIIDTYGGWGAHGGGAFSGKDPTKVDRSAAYVCRQMAKSVVRSGLCKRALVQLSYAIGVAKPLSLFVETYGSEIGDLTADDITKVIKIAFDCRPGAIAQSLALREPKYQETAAYCHFGRDPYTKDGIKFFEWENARDLSKYAKMNSNQIDAELAASNYLTKWVD